MDASNEEVLPSLQFYVFLHLVEVDREERIHFSRVLYECQFPTLSARPSVRSSKNDILARCVFHTLLPGTWLHQRFSSASRYLVRPWGIWRCQYLSLIHI